MTFGAMVCTVCGTGGGTIFGMASGPICSLCLQAQNMAGQGSLMNQANLANVAGQSLLSAIYTPVSPYLGFVGAVSSQLNLAGQSFAQPTFLPSPPPPPLEEGMKVEDLIGWRIWTVAGGYLKSFSADRLWLPDEPMTGEPGDQDGAGVWAFKKREDAVKKMGFAGQYAYGSVKLWGSVIEHTEGFRAANARILTIDDVATPAGTDWASLAILRERYGVPGVEEAAQKAAKAKPIKQALQPDYLNHLSPTLVAPRQKMNGWLAAAVAFNLTAGILNLILIFTR